ncbi:hypothetical protein SprV_0401723500 [Sparganum proliferum]
MQLVVESLLTFCSIGTQSAYGWTLSQTSPVSLRDSCSPLAAPRSKTSQSATSAYGGLVKLMGQLQCRVSFRVTNISANCYVTKSDLNLLGLDWIERLGLANMPLRVVCSQVQIPAVLADQAKVRTIPNPAFHDGVSPAEALMGRKLRTTFRAFVPTGVKPA